jgi:hypothetical protein
MKELSAFFVGKDGRELAESLPGKILAYDG